MQLLPEYDIAIVGGGLAGLAASIQLRRKGYSVILFEKETYPFNKVCGEYISFESWDFLLSLGLPLQEWDLPVIDTLQLTSPNGNRFTTRLPLGGFGVSRYKLDAALAGIAKEMGVRLVEKTKVTEISNADPFLLNFNQQSIKAKLCLAAYGKRSNLDIKWNRDFIAQQNKRLNNYVGIKYHIKTAWPQNVIGLHNFENGYCGISKIEGEKYCLCYLTSAENLKACGGNIEMLQEKFLFQNSHLKKIFETSEVLQHFPVTISQISFSQKSKFENGVLMLGDAAGMITPLCGNGMSIALHTSKLASSLADDYLQQNITRTALEERYMKQWQQQFGTRLGTGRMLQSFFGSNRLSNLFVGTFKTFPFLARPIIQLTHGKPF